MPVVGDRLERQLTFGPDPAPGRGLGGGCCAWITRPGHSLSILYVAVDGELWWQRDLRIDRVTSLERSARAPTSVGSTVVFAVDEAEVWLLDLDTSEARRLDDGRHAFCFDPAISPDGRVVSWQG